MLTNQSIGYMDAPVPKDLDLKEAIDKLRKEKNAIILAHYYQTGDIQDIADYVGDSLALAQWAAKTKADIIVLCGVHFMGETAKILCPDKKVLVPDLNAGCSLADSCPAPEFAEFVKQHPGHTVIITGRNMLLWDGACHVHEQFSLEKILSLKKQYPNAEVITHPECKQPVIQVSDFVGSTAALLKHTIKSDAKQFIVATESGVIHEMRKQSPDKEFIPAPPNDSTCACNECNFMRLNTMEKLYNCLKFEMPEIFVDEEVQKKAIKPIKKMLEISEKLGL